MNAPPETLLPRLPAKLSTPHQRLYARTLMRQLELDTQRISLMHRRVFEAANLTVPASGDDVDAVLCALTAAQISTLVSALKEEAGDE